MAAAGRAAPVAAGSETIEGGRPIASPANRTDDGRVLETGEGVMVDGAAAAASCSWKGDEELSRLCAAVRAGGVLPGAGVLEKKGEGAVTAATEDTYPPAPLPPPKLLWLLRLSNAKGDSSEEADTLWPGAEAAAPTLVIRTSGVWWALSAAEVGEWVEALDVPCTFSI